MEGCGVSYRRLNCAGYNASHDKKIGCDDLERNGGGGVVACFKIPKNVPEETKENHLNFVVRMFVSPKQYSKPVYPESVEVIKTQLRPSIMCTDV
jgi:hypothetical protein